MILGQESIELQPNEAEIVVGATCPGSCTEQKFSDTVYIKTAHLHMHYLGEVLLLPCLPTLRVDWLEVRCFLRPCLCKLLVI